MKFYTSYFYHVRNLKPNQIPVSTAIWPPKWFTNKGHCFIDKRGVINGVTCSWLVPGISCENLCRGPQVCAKVEPNNCLFLREYYKQISALDFDLLVNRLEEIGENAKNLLGFDEEPEIILMFHEKYDNPCSERWMIKRLFEEYNIYLEEYTKGV